MRHTHITRNASVEKFLHSHWYATLAADRTYVHVGLIVEHCMLNAIITVGQSVSQSVRHQQLTTSSSSSSSTVSEQSAVALSLYVMSDSLTPADLMYTYA